jgi:hypothetical protein
MKLRGNRSFVLLVLWAMSLVSLVHADVSSAGKDGPARDILVFARDGWVWRCDGEGNGKEKLFEGLLPGVSPDGRFVAFFRPRPGAHDDALMEFRLYDSTSGSTSPLAESVWPASAPVWSGDGSVIAFLARDTDSRTRVATLRPGGSGLRTLFSEGDEGSGFLCSLSPASQGTFLVHDMKYAYWLAPRGGLVERVPLDSIMGGEAGMVTSSDRLAVCPSDPGVLVFSHSCQGTARFESVMHEPSSALTLHDRWLGKGKNLRVTPQDVTCFDPVCSADGRRIYFIGYRDTQAAEKELFRVFRVNRFGSGLAEIAPGEGVSAASRVSGQ